MPAAHIQHSPLLPEPCGDRALFPLNSPPSTFVRRVWVSNGDRLDKGLWEFYVGGIILMFIWEIGGCGQILCFEFNWDCSCAVRLYKYFVPGHISYANRRYLTSTT